MSAIKLQFCAFAYLSNIILDTSNTTQHAVNYVQHGKRQSAGDLHTYKYYYTAIFTSIIIDNIVTLQHNVYIQITR